MYGSVLSVGDFDRNLILIIGSYPIDTKPFKERNLLVEKTSLDNARNYYKKCRAIVISEYPSKYGLIKKCSEQLFSDLENHGIAIKILGHDDQDLRAVSAILAETSVSLNNFYFINKINELAENIARYSPGPPVRDDIDIKGDVSKIDEEAKLLLCRSFYDCKKIHIELIPGGRDAKYLLKVHAWQANSKVTSSLMPFFVKISNPNKIEKEIAKYGVFTDLYIPFKYRPNCRIERCVRTHKYKSLVGNFVEDSIPLRSALRDMHHTGIIFPLFERSLIGFRRQPVVDNSSGRLVTFISDRIKINELLQRIDVISKARDLGLKSDVNQMFNKLLAICPGSYSMCTIHGDLHSGNVMVMANDAILIDFSAVKDDGHPAADPITLEISLSFNIGETEPQEFEKWREFIDEAYNPSQVAKTLEFNESVPNEFSWLRRSIRELRHILVGCHRPPDEIEVIMACYLMRIARLTPIERVGNKEEFEFKCHSYALVVAERIIDSLNEKH